MHRFSPRHVLLGVIAPLTLPLVACGSPDGTPSPSEHITGTEPNEAPETGQTMSAVVSGAANISDGAIPNSLDEEETAAVTFGGGNELVAYNTADSDPAHRKTSPSGGISVCPGYSQSAVSYFSNGSTWRSFRFPVPQYAGVAALHGDPAVAAVDSGNNWVVWVSSLAVSTTLFNAQANADGCVGAATFDSMQRQACLNAVVVPKDGTPAIPYLSACFGGDGDSLDGGSVFSSPATGNVYAAYLTTPGNIIGSTNKIAVFNNFVAMASPFPAGFIGHPKFIPHARIPTIVAPDNHGNFWLARLNESTQKWALSNTMTTTGDYGKMDDTVTLRNGTLIQTGQYSGDFYPAGFSDRMAFFYPTRPTAPPGTTVKKSHLQGVDCFFAGTTLGSCQPIPAWRTPVTDNAVFPAVSIVQVGASDIRPVVSYWYERPQGTNGTLTMALGRIHTNDSSFTTSMSAVSQIPCTFNGFFGDYDGMTVFGNGSSVPLLTRFFADSSDAACDPTKGRPQHVSVLVSLTP